MWKLTTIVLAMSGLSGVMYGQTPVDPAPTFEVASVRPNNSGSPNNTFGIRGDTFTSINGTLRELIRVAYQIRDLQIVDEPEWINSARFDINAKAVGPLKPGAFPLELRALLADRFGLRVHSESREMPIYALVVARTDGKFGPALQKVEVDRCPEARARAEARARSGQPPTPPVPGERMMCGLGYNPGTITGGSIELGLLAQRLSPIVGRFVMDRTGLAGKYDFDLKWAPEQNPEATGASIFTALQEQLGLKLESTRGPVDVLVIDRVQPLVPD